MTSAFEVFCYVSIFLLIGKYRQVNPLYLHSATFLLANHFWGENGTFVSSLLAGLALRNEYNFPEGGDEFAQLLFWATSTAGMVQFGSIALQSPKYNGFICMGAVLVKVFSSARIIRDYVLLNAQTKNASIENPNEGPGGPVATPVGRG
jgi:hypothetical protein